MREVVIAASVGVVTVLAGLELNGFFVEGAIAGLVCLLCAAAGGVLVLWGIVRRRDRLAVRGLLVLGSLATGIVLVIGASSIQIRASKERGDRIAARLSAFHAARGTYPSSLDDLVPEHLARIPPTAMGLIRTQSFGYRCLQDGYELWFQGSSGDWHKRGPNTPWTWID